MKKYKTIAVDFDGTLCVNAFPSIGAPKPVVINFIKDAHKKGHKIIIWTCRTGDYLSQAISWLKYYGVPYDTLNENYSPSKDFNPRKVVADLYIDDRAINADDLEGFNIDTLEYDNSEVIDDIETLLKGLVYGVLEGELDNWEAIHNIAEKYGFTFTEEMQVERVG